jgi:four helix bundle protein
MERPHKRLEAWRTAMKMAEEIYSLTRRFPAEEKYGLAIQMRRAAVSIPSNIAEGAARQGKKEFRNFLSMAQGSLSELDTQLEISLSLGYLEHPDFEKVSGKIALTGKMLSGLIRSITEKVNAG